MPWCLCGSPRGLVALGRKLGGKMGLGATNITDGARSIYAPPVITWGSPAGSWASSIPDGDSALAILRHLHRAQLYGIAPTGIDGSDPTFQERLKWFAETFSKSLAAYIKLIEEISNGRFSAKALREAIENVGGTPGMYLWSGILDEHEVASVLSGSKRSGALAAYGMDGPLALAWLRANLRCVLLTVLLSMKNIEAERVLYLLRAMINITSERSRDR